MSSGFTTNALLPKSRYPVLKGDIAGHEFHGNQYQTGAAGELGKQAASHEAKGRFKSPTYSTPPGVKNPMTTKYSGGAMNDQAASTLREIADHITTSDKPLSEHLKDINAARQVVANHQMSNIQSDIYNPTLTAQGDALEHAANVVGKWSRQEDAAGVGKPTPGLMENQDHYDARSASHADWAKGDMKNNSPITTMMLGQKDYPTGAHLEPRSQTAVDADDAARGGYQQTATRGYESLRSSTYPDSPEREKLDEAVAYHSAQKTDGPSD